MSDTSTASEWMPASAARSFARISCTLFRVLRISHWSMESQRTFTSPQLAELRGAVGRPTPSTSLTADMKAASDALPRRSIMPRSAISRSEMERPAGAATPASGDS